MSESRTKGRRGKLTKKIRAMVQRAFRPLARTANLLIASPLCGLVILMPLMGYQTAQINQRCDTC